MGRTGLAGALDRVLEDADLDPSCQVCGGARRHSTGVVVTRNLPVLSTCPACDEYVNAAGKAVSKRLPDGSSFVKHVNLVVRGASPGEVT
jgi:hypothetical protein